MNCEFANLKQDFNALMVIICVAALAVVSLDVLVWRKDAPKPDPTCIKPEPRTVKAIGIFLDGCIK